MAYPGNPELSVQAQERVIAAFRQVINKLQEGQRQEALLGLEFVLRMDSSFAPATNLHQQLSSGAENIDLSTVISDLQAPTTDTINELLVSAVDAFNNRDFVEAEELVRKVLVEMPGHRDARDLLGQIQEALKVGGQAGQFLAQAREALDNNDPQEAANFVMMAQALDPHYSGIDAMLKEIQAASESVHQQRPQDSELGEGSQDEGEGAYQTMAFDTSQIPQAPTEAEEFSFDEPETGASASDIEFESDPGSGAQDFSFDSKEESDAGTPQEFSFEPVDESPAQDFGFEASPAQESAPTEDEPVSDFAFDSGGLDDAKGSADAASEEFGFDSSAGEADLFSVEPEGDADFGAPPAEGSGGDSFDFDSQPRVETDEFSFGGDSDSDFNQSDDGPSLFDAPAADSGDLFSDAAAVSPDVDTLIQEGQDAFHDGSFAKAIEIWSRVFTIDPAHDKATELIDLAREKLEETERQVEHMLMDAADAEEAGDTAQALELANSILTINPESPEALDMKRRLGSGSQAAVPVDASPTLPDTDTVDDLFEDVSPDIPLGSEDEESPDIELDIPESPGKSPQVQVKKTIPYALIGIISAAVLVILIGMWMGSRFLSSAKEDKQVEALNHVLEQSERLFQNNRVDEAIHLLEEFQVSDINRERIQRRIEKYKQATLPPTPTPIPDSLIQGEQLLDEGKWLSAYKIVQEGLAKHPQDVGLAELRESLLSIEPNLGLLVNALNKKDFNSAAKLSEEIVSRHPDNPELRQAMLDSIFNSALQSLRAYSLTGAEQSLRRLERMEPEDQEVQRILEFIGKYKARPVDMQLEIFISSIKER